MSGPLIVTTREILDLMAAVRAARKVLNLADGAAAEQAYMQLCEASAVLYRLEAQLGTSRIELQVAA